MPYRIESSMLWSRRCLRSSGASPPPSSPAAPAPPHAASPAGGFPAPLAQWAVRTRWKKASSRRSIRRCCCSSSTSGRRRHSSLPSPQLAGSLWCHSRMSTSCPAFPRVRPPPTNSACQQQEQSGSPSLGGGQSLPLLLARRAAASTALRISSASASGTGSCSSSCTLSECARAVDRGSLCTSPGHLLSSSTERTCRGAAPVSRLSLSSDRCVPPASSIAHMWLMPTTRLSARFSGA
mmetsp:Transcript_38185/g.126447  ORF Transcript_38185/g.126447 Transcript_38185/m.126447 type:complete len:237 (+) Transcript_38185:1609-2319(+)